MIRPLTNHEVQERLVAYARQHRCSIARAEELAGGAGLSVPGGTLMLIGARWSLNQGKLPTRRFRVQLPTQGERIVEVSTRARLAINLTELGYSIPRANSHAKHSWSKGLALNGNSVVITELT